MVCGRPKPTATVFARMARAQIAVDGHIATAGNTDAAVCAEGVDARTGTRAESECTGQVHGLNAGAGRQSSAQEFALRKEKPQQAASDECADYLADDVRGEFAARRRHFERVTNRGDGCVSVNVVEVGATHQVGDGM